MFPSIKLYVVYGVPNAQMDGGLLNQHLRNIVRAARLPHPKMETRTDAGSHLLDAATFALYQVSQTPCFRCLLSISPAAEQLDICARPIATQFPQDPGRKLACNLGCSKGKQYLPTKQQQLIDRAVPLLSLPPTTEHPASQFGAWLRWPQIQLLCYPCLRSEPQHRPLHITIRLSSTAAHVPSLCRAVPLPTANPPPIFLLPDQFSNN